MLPGCSPEELVGESFDLFAQDGEGGAAKGLAASGLKAAMLFLYGYEPPQVNPSARSIW